MNINSVNNFENKYYTQPQFRARFTEAQLREFCKPVNNFGDKINIYEYFPKLYTLLQRLDQIKPGAVATYSRENRYTRNCKDVIEISGENFYSDAADANNSKVNILEGALVANPYACLYKDRAFMPMSIYERKWWDNLDKTAEDVMKDFSFVEQNTKSEFIPSI